MPKGACLRALGEFSSRSVSVVFAVPSDVVNLPAGTILDNEVHLVEDNVDFAMPQAPLEWPSRTLPPARLGDEHSTSGHPVQRPRQRDIKCPICGRDLSTKSNLKIHLRDIHGPSGASQFSCPDCGRLVKSQSALRVHLYRHRQTINHRLSSYALIENPN